MKNKNLWLFIAIIISFSSCDLEENPVATTTKAEIFGTESGLQLYVNSFYGTFPGIRSQYTIDYLSDINARNSRHQYLTAGAFGPASSTAGWDWGDLRNINYLLENNVNPEIPEVVKNNFNGLARFWRAWFYFEKVKQFGDVPWIDRPLDVEDEDELYGSRDPRTLVMDNVLADLNYAIENIIDTDNSRTKVTRDVALAFKSRVCLFEGTWRKYHIDLGLTNTADEWLKEAANAARTLMDEGNYSIFTGAGTEMSYRTVFTSVSPIASEVIFGRAFDAAFGMNHGANWDFNSSTYGVQLSPIRTFINTYLMIDGTPFTDIDGYDTMTFVDEVKDRDKRLQQSIRLGDYKRISGGSEIPGAPDFGFTLTGYHPIKLSLDDEYYDGDTRNDNFYSILRYAEVLLNYAEAKAELGTITDSDWAETIGILRARGGIISGIDALPTVVDTYMQTEFFPDISDPIILEVRRERAIELWLEDAGRFNDIRRWRQGHLMELPYVGIYVPEVNQYMDLNEDGSYNVYFYYGDPPDSDDRTPGVSYVDVNPGGNRWLSEGTSGHILWLENQPRTWEDKLYLWPIPEHHRILNSNLGQNPGW